MNEARIRKLIEIFRDSGVDEMEYRESFWRGISLRLGRRRSDQPQAVSFTTAPVAAPAPPAPAATPAAAPPAAAPPAPGGEPADAEPAPAAEDSHAVTSPMVGTFYTAPSPEADDFVAVGDKVRKGQTLCIIEAMKIMNEIEADIDGEVLEISAPNGEPVEYGQALFRLRPA